MGQANKLYQIYALIDPRDNSIRYIGMSADVHVRFYGHLKSHKANEGKRRWLAELQRKGIEPALQILETIEASGDAYAIACEREHYWIDEMIRLGSPLLNIIGIKRSYFPPTKDISTRHKMKSSKMETPSSTAKSAEWLSVEAIAKELGVHPDTVRGWIRDRKIQATKLGRDYRIRRIDLDKFLKDRTITPEEQDDI